MSIQKSITKTYSTEIYSRFVRAIKEYELIQENDRIAVCISGGKDSMLMAYLLKLYQDISEIPYTLKFLVMNPGYQEEHLKQIEHNAKLLEIPIEIHDTQIFDVIESEKNPCYRCARMRRGSLYQFAKEMGCNKIALGHHFDDVIETTLLNLFYAGKTGTMLPRLTSTSNPDMELIRPLYLVKEVSILNWSKYNDLTFLNCACNFVENRIDESKRREVKNLINMLEKDNPFLRANLFRSMENVNLNHIMSYFDDQEKTAFLDRFE